MSNYPAGAKNDPRAPYNEQLTRRVNFNINIVCDIDKSIDIPENIRDYSSYEYDLRSEIVELLENQGFLVSEIVIVNE